MSDPVRANTGAGVEGVGPGDPLRRLASRLLDEQRARWEGGDPAPVEDYLRRHPELRADPEAVVDLIFQEVLLHKEKGRVLGLSDCVRRFPHYEAELRDQFELHELLESPSLGGPVSVTWLSSRPRPSRRSLPVITPTPCCRTRDVSPRPVPASSRQSTDGSLACFGPPHLCTESTSANLLRTHRHAHASRCRLRAPVRHTDVPNAKIAIRSIRPEHVTAAPAPARLWPA
jgi:hypothetical protein